MKRVLVTGALGQLGCELQELTKGKSHYIFTDITPKEGVQSLDICNREELLRFVKDNKIERIINCAAYTNVEGAETNVDLCMKINVEGVENLALVAKACGCTMVHISTDYVFDGERVKGQYTEQSKVRPISVYGLSKLRGELAMILSKCNGIIIRTAWLYSPFGNNFVKTMIRLGKERDEIKVVNDQIGSPTYARHLAQLILHILPKISYFQGEIFNYTNEGSCSWYEFAQEIFTISQSKVKVTPIQSSQYPTKAARPSYSVLDKTKIKKEFGRDIPGWSAALKECLKRMEGQ